MSKNVDPFKYFSLEAVAEKLSDNKRNLKKNLEKAQKLSLSRDDLDGCLSRDNDEKSAGVFGKPLEFLPECEVSIEFKNKQFPVQIPVILRDIGSRLLKNVDVEGLFRKSPSFRRISFITEALEANPSALQDQSDLSPHELAHLLKEWVKELPYSLVPSSLLPYVLRLFDGTQRSSGRDAGLSDPDKREVLRFLGTSFPASNRNVIIYVSYVLSSVAKRSTMNHMTSRNLALVWPSVFSGSYRPKTTNNRSFEDAINMTEFFINNPYIFHPSVQLTRNGSFVDNRLEFEHLPKHVKFEAPYMPCSPKRKKFEFDLRTPVQSIRIMGRSTVNSVRDKLKMTGEKCGRNSLMAHPDRSHFPTPEPAGFPRIETAFKEELKDMQISSPMSSSPAREIFSSLGKDRPVEPSMKALYSSGSFASPKSYGDVEMASPGQAKQSPVRLDFEQQTVCCKRCKDFSDYDLAGLRKKSVLKSTQNVECQVDLGLSEQLGFLSLSIEDGVAEKMPTPERMAVPKMHKQGLQVSPVSGTPSFRQLSVAAVIPNGIVARRVRILRENGGKPM
ncbi:hypothetical protein RvY_09545-2 [Ramazzottius varieornatus]|nr:hypothetical protein RvY_09545-2 [Ramazzottius varieornatus]